MIDDEEEPTTLEAVAAANPSAAANGPAPETSSPMANKSFWAGVGIGSAALVAALMYAQRGKKKK
jgi:hypothetical protein